MEVWKKDIFRLNMYYKVVGDPEPYLIPWEALFSLKALQYSELEPLSHTTNYYLYTAKSASDPSLDAMWLVSYRSSKQS